MEHTRKVIFLESRQMAVVTRDTLTIETLEGAKVKPVVHTVSWDPIAAEKGEYRHFMQKEIHEQVRALTDTLAGRVDFANGRIRLPDLNLTEEFARKIEKIYITACGTAAYAGMVGKYLIEKIARIPVEVVIASEFRYSDPILNENTVVLAISQSGETADTLAAMEEGRSKGATIWSIVNAIGSQAIRVADGFISMQTGPEIGVASTKAFTAPLVDQYMLAILLADLRGVIDEKTRKELVSDLRLIPDLVGRTLDRDADVEKVALALKDIRDCLYLGRGINMPIAYEGALKLKEISYIHAEGYPAGEMKHGPIALIDEHMPVLCIAPRPAASGIEDQRRDQLVTDAATAQLTGVAVSPAVKLLVVANATGEGGAGRDTGEAADAGRHDHGDGSLSIAQTVVSQLAAIVEAPAEDLPAAGPGTAVAAAHHDLRHTGETRDLERNQALVERGIQCQGVLTDASVEIAAPAVNQASGRATAGVRLTGNNLRECQPPLHERRCDPLRLAAVPQLPEVVEPPAGAETRRRAYTAAIENAGADLREPRVDQERGRAVAR